MEGSDFYQKHSDIFLTMALTYDKNERLHQPDGYGKKTGDCGDTAEIFLIIRDRTIVTAAFSVDGCVNTFACANLVAHLVEGKSVAAAWQITPEMIRDKLETLPPDHFHCAELAVGALYLALGHHARHAGQPWKKAYQAIDD